MSDQVDETQGCARRITTDISAMCAMNVRYAKNVDSKNAKRVWCVCRATPIVTKTTYCEADGDVDTLRSTSTSTTTTTTFVNGKKVTTTTTPTNGVVTHVNGKAVITSDALSPTPIVSLCLSIGFMMAQQWFQN